jgi:hypothetical protein
MLIKPAPGLLVPNPEAAPGVPRHLAAEGAEVPDTEYWRRRLADGDVLLAEADAPEAAEPRRRNRETLP